MRVVFHPPSVANLRQYVRSQHISCQALLCARQCVETSVLFPAGTRSMHSMRNLRSAEHDEGLLLQPSLGNTKFARTWHTSTALPPHVQDSRVYVAAQHGAPVRLLRSRYSNQPSTAVPVQHNSMSWLPMLKLASRRPAPLASRVTHPAATARASSLRTCVRSITGTVRTAHPRPGAAHCTCSRGNSLCRRG
jgi:hypothetical protein